MRNASLATRAPSRVLRLQIRSPRRLGEYNLTGELFENKRKRTKAKESKIAFFCFLLLFGIGAFQWVMAEKSRKIPPLRPFASGLHSPPPARCFSPHRPPSVPDSTLHKRYHLFLFSASYSPRSYRAGCWSATLRARQGCFPVVAALDAAIHGVRSHPRVRYSSTHLFLGAATTGVSNAWMAGSGGDGGEAPSWKIWTRLSGDSSS